MPKARWIEFDGRDWRLSELAVSHQLRPQTLAARLDRGYPVERALATGLCSRSEAGQRAAAAWRR
jgi:hypothetical protein